MILVRGFKMAIWKDKSVLVPGGAGFIGSNLVHRLVAEGARVTVIDSLIPDLGGNPFNLEPISNKVEFVREDLLKSRALPEVVKKVSTVFHLAGNVSHIDSMRMPFGDLEMNAGATLAVAEAVRKENPEAVIVFSSTRQIYGKAQYLPVDENHSIDPIDINGIHKYAAESYLSLYSKAHRLKTVSLRLTNTYGPRQLIRHSRQGFIGWFMHQVLHEKPIELFGGGLQERDFTEVGDVVEAFLLAASNERCFGHSFNLGGERMTIENIARVLVAIGGKGKVEETPFPPSLKNIELGHYYGSFEKFTKETGWRPKVGIREGLTRMLAFYKEHKEHYL